MALGGSAFHRGACCHLGFDNWSVAVSGELIPDPAWDFSNYRAGDVLVLPKSKIVTHGQAMTFIALSKLSAAAGKAGLLIETEFDDARDELRVVFK